MIRSSGLIRIVVVLLFLLCLRLTGLAVTPAIRSSIDESSLVVLKGNTHPLAKAEFDRGPADSSVSAGRMLLVLKRSAAQEADMQALLSQLRDKNSPNYGKWLTPQQFGDRFGASATDISTLTAWLESHGLTVKSVGPARTTIEFTGTIGQLQSTFHTAIHRFAVDGVDHLANTADPQIPSALARVIAGIAGMNDLFPTSGHTAPLRATYNKATHRSTPETATTAGGNLLYLGPADAAAIYDVPSTYNANWQGHHTYTGNGVTIAVVSDANIHPSDVDAYRSFFGLPASTPRVVIDGGNDPGVDAFTTGDSQRALMSVEVAGALAPGATVVLYTARNTTLSSGLYMAASRALNDNIADIVQVGFSSCEAELAAAGNQFFEQLWVQGAMQGVSVVVGSGDSGSAGCDTPQTSTSAQSGYAVNGIASTNYNIAVGGTDFDTLPSNFAGFVGSNGVATGYIPEYAWNDSVAAGSNGSSAANTPFQDNSGTTDIFASGGGASSCINGAASGTVCTAPANGQSKPLWQTIATGLNIPQDGVRDIPDISMFAGTGRYGAAWAVCGNDYDANGNPIADCAPGSGAAANIQGMGGTAASSAAFSGVLAMVVESNVRTNKTKRLGLANLVLYADAFVNVNNREMFHDVTAGNNSVVCAPGSPNCGSNGFLTGYDAGPLWDAATGFGSVDADKLISDWGDIAFAPTTTVLTVNGTSGPVTAAHGTKIDFEVSVTGGPPAPTGLAGIVATVDETNNTYGDDVGFAKNLVNGAMTQSATNVPGGTYNVLANYAGDLNDASSTSAPVQLVISKEDSTLQMRLYTRDATGVHQITAPGANFIYGTYVSVDGKPAGLSRQGIATGTVSFFDNGVTLTTPADNLNYLGFAEVPQYSWSTGSHSITGSYSGDNSFNPSATTGPMTFTIGQAASSLTVAVTPVSLINGTATVTGIIAPTTPVAGMAAPTGSITLTDTTNGAALGVATLISGTDPKTGTAVATFTLTINSSSLALGANTLTAVYPGDTNYIGATGSAIITLLAHLATSMTVTAAPATLTTGTTVLSGQVTATGVTTGAAPTGTITFTDAQNGAALGMASLTAGSGPAATFTLTIDATALVAGANLITATYGGDNTYAGSSGTVTVTLTATPPANASFTITGTSVTVVPATPATSAVTVTPVNGYTGQVNLTAQLTSGPNGALSPPTIAFSSSSVSVAGTSSASDTATVTTTILKFASEHAPPTPQNRWYAAGGATLACVLFFGVPARRRPWKTMLGLLVFAIIGLGTGCGVRLNQLVSNRTTPGIYVFTVTGADAGNPAITASGTITVTVQ